MYALYSTGIIRGHIDTVASDGTVRPYVGTATLWLKKPSWTAPQAFTIVTNSAGDWSYEVFRDEPGIWSYVDRLPGLGGAELDQSFLVDESFAPRDT